LFIQQGSTRSRQTFSQPIEINVDRQVLSPPNSPWTAWRRHRASLAGTQVTESDGNWLHLPKGNDIADSGSEFYTRKTEILSYKRPYSVVHCKPTPGGLQRNLRIFGGPFIANAFGDRTHLNSNIAQSLGEIVPAFPDLSTSRAGLVVKGSLAVAACNPGNQIANVASAVGELLQDVPNIPGAALWESRLRALETLASTGDEFLNIVFGVLPTLSDMEQFVKAVHKVDKAVVQFERDSGRVVRRQFHFPKEVTTTEEVLPGILSPVGSQPIVVGGVNTCSNVLYQDAQRGFPTYTTIRHRTVERDIWFSGAFTYHLPSWYDNGSRADRMRLSAQLLGARPDLNTLWQLTPWSWAVDWVTNAGSFVKNLNSLLAYGTILRYGYVMETTTVTDTYRAGSVWATPAPADTVIFKPPYPTIAPVTLRVTTKKRIKANPFGFGISWDGLSSIQQAIVAALGISRVAR